MKIFIIIIKQKIVIEIANSFFMHIFFVAIVAILRVVCFVAILKTHNDIFLFFLNIFSRYHLYLKSPEAKPTSSSYLKTLNEGLWLASILMFSTLAVSLWFVTRIINKTKIYNERNVSIFSCFLTVTSGFLNQGKFI